MKPYTKLADIPTKYIGVLFIFFHHFKIAAICKIYDFLFGFHGKTGKQNSMQLLGSYKFISTLQNTILGSVGRCRCIILANIKITAYIFEHLLQFHEFLK